MQANKRNKRQAVPFQQLLRMQHQASSMVSTLEGIYNVLLGARRGEKSVGLAADMAMPAMDLVNLLSERLDEAVKGRRSCRTAHMGVPAARRVA